MVEGGVSIWFFAGVSLLVNGAVILASGIWEWINPPANPVVLFNLHAAIWWGAILFVVGIFYTFHFAPSRRRA